jgi:hypothetical protein
VAQGQALDKDHDFRFFKNDFGPFGLFKGLKALIFFRIGLIIYPEQNGKLDL